MSHTGDWYIQPIGCFTFVERAAESGTRFRPDAALDPSQWNIAALNPAATRLERQLHVGRLGKHHRFAAADLCDVVWRHLACDATGRRSTTASATTPIRTWRRRRTSRTNSILIDSGIPSRVRCISSTGTTDYGYKRDIRDWRNVAPRGGFTYNIGGRNDFVIRGGTGLYFARPVSNVTFSPQLYSRSDHGDVPQRRPAGLHHQSDQRRALRTHLLRRGAKLPAQSPRDRSTDFRSPYTWQSSIGFQKQTQRRRPASKST